jgi:hypothetical protein
VEASTAEKPKRSKPLLDLSSLERETVQLRDGSIRELRNLNEFGVGEQHQLRRRGQEFDRLWESDEDLTDQETARLKFLTNELFDRLVVAPTSVKKRVQEGDRAQIILIFTSAPYASLLAMARAQQEADEAQKAAEAETTSTSDDLSPG